MKSITSILLLAALGVDDKATAVTVTNLAANQLSSFGMLGLDGEAFQAASVDTKTKAVSKSKTTTKAATKTKSKAHSKLKHKSKAKGKAKGDKSMTERAAEMEVDTKITKEILEAAANDISSSQEDEEFEFHDDKVKVTDGTPSKKKVVSHAQADPEAEAKPDEKAADKPAEKAEGGDQLKAVGNDSGDNKTAGAPADSNKGQDGWTSTSPKDTNDPNYWNKMHGNYHGAYNWWEKPWWAKTEPAKDDTPDEIKNHPAYEKMVDRFLPKFVKDENLENHLKKGEIDHDKILEEKEREGYYPNDLDQEMQHYTYGERLNPQWYPYSHDPTYSNYWRDQETFAPTFDPRSHFESPYYHYGNRYYGWNGTYPGGDHHGYWGYGGHYAQQNSTTNGTLAQAPKVKSDGELIDEIINETSDDSDFLEDSIRQDISKGAQVKIAKDEKKAEAKTEAKEEPKAEPKKQETIQTA